MAQLFCSFKQGPNSPLVKKQSRGNNYLTNEATMRFNSICKLIIEISIITTATVASANFGGFSMTETPLSSMETVIDNLLHEAKLDQKYVDRPSNLLNIKKALLKGCSKDYTLLHTLRGQTIESQNAKEVNSADESLRQNLILSTARIYGYLE